MHGILHLLLRVVHIALRMGGCRYDCFWIYLFRLDCKTSFSPREGEGIEEERRKRR
jgi:hypothetical protein